MAFDLHFDTWSIVARKHFAGWDMVCKINISTEKSQMRDKLVFVTCEMLDFLIDSLRPSQQFSSYVGTGLPGLKQF